MMPEAPGTLSPCHPGRRPRQSSWLLLLQDHLLPGVRLSMENLSLFVHHSALQTHKPLQNKEVISATLRYDTFQVNFQCISLHVRVLWDSTPAIPVISLKTPCACHTSAMLIHVIAYPSTRMVPFTDTLLLLRMLFLHGCPHVMQTYCCLIYWISA